VVLAHWLLFRAVGYSGGGVSYSLHYFKTKIMAQQEKNFRYRVTGIAVLSYPFTVVFESTPGLPTPQNGQAVGKCPWEFNEVLEFETPQDEAAVLLHLKAPAPGFIIGDSRALKVERIPIKKDPITPKK
jgi:hypothetical protein